MKYNSAPWSEFLPCLHVNKDSKKEDFDLGLAEGCISRWKERDIMGRP